MHLRARRLTGRRPPGSLMVLLSRGRDMRRWLHGDGARLLVSADELTALGGVGGCYGAAGR